jgi:hypothetical protein
MPHAETRRFKPEAVLFVGNKRGGQTAAILSSLTSACRRHNIDPQRYLTQLLTNLPATLIGQINQWLPDDWKRHNPLPSRQDRYPMGPERVS